MLEVLTARPDPRLQFFIRSYAEREAHFTDTQSVEPVVARLGGRARILIRGKVKALSVFFAPFALRALFGLPTAELIDIGTDGHALLGADVSTLYQQLGNASGFKNRVQLVDQFFLQRAIRSSSTLAGISLLRPLIATGTSVNVTEAASQAGLSTRQLERRALEYAGMSPKLINRIARFERAMILKVKGSASWTEIAHATNYHDQMHMIRDFRSLAGDTPTRTLEIIRPEHLSRLALPNIYPASPGIAPSL